MNVVLPHGNKTVSLPIAVARSRTSRVSLKVRPDGVIDVRAPGFVSQRRIESFIEQKQAWISKHYESYRQLYSFEDGRLTDDISIGFVNGPQLALKYTDSHLMIYRPDDMAQDWWPLYKYARPTIKRLLLAQNKSLSAKVEDFSRLHALNFSSIKWRFTRSRWGSCNSRQVLMFNTQLLRLPAQLQEYVIAHELAHTRHMNHGSQYHELLKTMIPRARSRSRQLAAFQLLH